MSESYSPRVRNQIVGGAGALETAGPPNFQNLRLWSSVVADVKQRRSQAGGRLDKVCEEISSARKKALRGGAYPCPPKLTRAAGLRERGNSKASPSNAQRVNKGRYPSFQARLPKQAGKKRALV